MHSPYTKNPPIGKRTINKMMKNDNQNFFILELEINETAADISRLEIDESSDDS